jgi:hypothetical protein
MYHAAQRGQRRNIITIHIQARCAQMGATTSTQVPIILTEFVTMVMAGNYSTTDFDDLTQGGLTPYQVNHRVQVVWATIIEANAVDHDRMLSGEMSPSLSECQQLKITTVDHLAYISLIDTGLAALSISNNCLIGPGHRLSVVHLRDDI